LVCGCPWGEELIGEVCLKSCSSDQIRGEDRNCKNKPCTMHYVAGHRGTMAKSPEGACRIWEQYVPQGYKFSFVSPGVDAFSPDACIYKSNSSDNWHIRPMEQKRYQVCPG
ncbi:MAG: hypothetical protein ACRCWR_07715, partial [Saezia sp.]